jgi:myo-inositol 2-dehydrogenase / D-chiro-inositol 1-dehydrogenase
MHQPIRIAVAGLGRMGSIHALHVYELARETGDCTLAALCSGEVNKAERFAAEVGLDVPIFRSVDELARARVSDATVIATPTPNHREHATALIAQGQRVLLEKPMTEVFETDLEFATELDAAYPHALMLAFQRRFDPPLLYAKELVNRGAIGRIFKVYSAMEDSRPAPDGFKSGGILADMSIHNVDEVLWLTGKMPRAALMIGSRLYSHRLTTCEEDFDDALLYLWFEGELTAEIQVGRNHVAGYRTETVIYGEEGEIQVDRFCQKPREVVVTAFGRRGRKEPIAGRSFPMRDYGRPLAEFVERFGLAYKTELAEFVACCKSDQPFPVAHWDGVRAQQVIRAGMQSTVRPEPITAPPHPLPRHPAVL